MIQIKISYAVAYALYRKELENFNTNQSIDVNGMIRFLKDL
ncbi:hypothetical protein [Campylobacter volucris]|nr:hypothetical protein [Campylobacter volucris]